jgi:putative GTP pyrophosphokinase
VIDLEDARERWLIEQDTYGNLGRHVRDILERETRARGLPVRLEYRAKDVASLLKKILKKSYSSYEEVGDKVGVRAVLPYPALIHTVDDLIMHTFNVQKRDDKRETLDFDRLGYLGIHYDVTLPDDLVDGDPQPFRTLRCEIQVHTLAENLWATVSHDLSYKSPKEVPLDIKRAIYRLVAIVEVFDSELTQAREAILAMPDFREAQILNELERHFYRFSAREFDRELSLVVVSGLINLLSPQEQTGIGHLIDAFVAAHEPKLSQIFIDYASDTRASPLLFQPEALLIFERLEADEFKTRDAWEAFLPLSLLEKLAVVWGKPLP